MLAKSAKICLVLRAPKGPCIICQPDFLMLETANRPPLGDVQKTGKYCHLPPFMKTHIQWPSEGPLNRNASQHSCPTCCDGMLKPCPSSIVMVQNLF